MGPRPRQAEVPRSKGAHEVVHADLRDPGRLAQAASGVDGVFLIVPAFAPDSTALGLNMVRGAE